MSPKRSLREPDAAAEPKKQMVKKLDHREWLLLRPDTHIGEVKPMELPHLTVRSDGDDDEATASTVLRARFAPVTISPALVRLTVELLMNALDNARRCRTQRYIRVTIDPASGRISVRNDGSTLPIEPFASIPEKNTVTVAFSHFLVSSNYDDDEDRYGAGKNGVGGKGCNVFAADFEVEVVNPPQQFKQRFEHNMELEHPAQIKRVATKTPSTLVRWLPDYGRLGMAHVVESGRLGAAEADVLRGLVYAVAVCAPPKVGVWLDDRKLALRTTEALVRALGVEGSIATDTIALAGAEQEGDLCFSISVGAKADPAADGLFLAWVNGTPCNEGTHAKYVLAKVVDALFGRVRAKAKGKEDPLLNVRPRAVRDEMVVVCTLLVRNPRFTSQQKTELASSVPEFGFGWSPSERFQAQLAKSDLATRALELGARNTDRQLAKAIKPRARDVPPKYEKARKLRTGRAALIVTEGDSAQNVATVGVGVVGRDDYGIFPIRGKLLNALNASKKQLVANQEVRNLIAILNLDVERTYTAVDTLDYSHLVILSDQDPDGAHIRGLLILFVHTLFPSVLTAFPNFVRVFATPLVRASHGAQSWSFFNEPDFREWREARAAAGLPVGMIKYYKGLGALSNAFAKTLFADMDRHVVTLMFRGAPCADALARFFDERRADDRKAFLTDAYDPRRLFDFSCGEASIGEWCEEDVSHFLMYNNTRSLPHVVDGLKTSQRKVLHGCFKLNYVKGRKEEMKVFQMVGSIAAETKYHHGDASLTGTLTKMAAEYPGSNNVALLWGDGQFGSKLRHDPASSRYISSFLEPIARFLFPAADDGVLERVEIEGKVVEPRFFCPIVPLVLINGADGIGSGWSTFLPQFRPFDVLDRVRRHIRTAYGGGATDATEDDVAPPPLTPWYRGYEGTIERADDGNFVSAGVVSKEVVGTVATVSITQLPIGAKEDAEYAEDLKKLLVDRGVCTHALDVHQDTEDVWKTRIRFRCSAAALDGVNLDELLKMRKRLVVSNIHLWGPDGKLHRYSVEDIVAVHAEERLELYRRRVAAQLEVARADHALAHAKRRYIEMARSGAVRLRVATKAELCEQIEAAGLPRRHGGYAYLTGLPNIAMTDEAYDELAREAAALEADMTALERTDPLDVWRAELDALEVALTEYDRRAQGDRPDVSALA